jgi:predicted component of type VI protein secretion system
MIRLAVFAAVLLAACAAPPPVPPPAGLTVERFFAFEPARLRAAVLTDARAIFQAVDLNVVEQMPQQPPANYVIRLQQPLATDPRLPPAPPGRNWQVFALSAEATTALATVREMLLSRPRGQAPAEIRVSVSAQPALVPADLMAALPLRIDLLLDDRDGWFTEVGPTTLDLSRSAARPG